MFRTTTGTYRNFWLSFLASAEYTWSHRTSKQDRYNEKYIRHFFGFGPKTEVFVEEFHNFSEGVNF